MDDWSQYLTTRTGFWFHVRPACPADEGTLAGFFTHVTRDDLRFRFLTGLDEVGHDRVAELVTIDHKCTENFLAFDLHGSMMIATAKLACDPGLDRGEVAVCIRKDFKHCGIGRELPADIAHFAEVKGVKTLESTEAHENHAAPELERDMGFTAEPYPGDSTLVLVRRTLDQVAHA